MLEAYEAYSDYNDFMTLVEDLVRAIAEAVVGDLEVESSAGSIDLAKPFRRASMFEVIEETTGRGLEQAWRDEDWGTIGKAAEELGVRVQSTWSPGKIVAEIFEETTERKLIQPTFVAGFPKEVSPLAKDHRTLAGFTEHCDLILNGLEIAPIYSELNDPAEQRRRFEQQAAIGAQGDQEAALPDAEFLEALSYGMPPAAGFGLGVDRLLTTLLGESSLREIIMFPTLKPEA
jgi:lysyl-tRNA synthetase class 2